MRHPTDHETGRSAPPRRSTKLATIGLGAAVCGLLGTGLVAMTSDTAASTGNDALSGTFTPLTHDLDIAQVTGTTGDCTTATYEEATTAAIALLSGANVNLDTGTRIEQGDASGQKDFCLKNAGAGLGSLTLQFTSVTDVESTCATNEATLGGDATCGTGAGELRTMLRPAFSTGTDTSASCAALTQAAWSTYESGAQEIDADLAPGEICRVHLTVFQTSPASDVTKLAAQTDEVRWTISFVLQD